MLEDSPSSGEPVGSGSGGFIDWRSLRLQADFGPMDDEFADWSSHSSSEEEWDWGPTYQQEKVLSEVKNEPESSEGTGGAVQITVSVRKKFLNRPSTPQTRAAEYRRGS